LLQDASGVSGTLTPCPLSLFARTIKKGEEIRFSMIVLPDFDSLWDYGKPAETEQAFRAMLAEHGDTADAAYVAELETQIARTLGLQRKFDEALVLLDAVEPKLNSVRPRVRVRYLLEKGRVYNSSGRKDVALPLFVESWELGKQIGEDGFAVDAAHMVAIAAKPEATLEWNLVALDLATSSEMPSARKWRKSLHNNIGWTFFEMADYDRAMEQFAKCREVSEEMADSDSERIARWSIAKTHRLQGRAETGLEMQLGQFKEHEAAGRTSGYNVEEIAECLLALGRAEEAAPYFGMAFDELSKDPWVVNDEPERLARLRQLSGRAEG
jgi:tetratricopeptide (TPR) repeat protein